MALTFRDKKIAEWALATFREGCAVGETLAERIVCARLCDIAKDALENEDDSEMDSLEFALEGWYAAGGETVNTI